jgi:hypothetical protein
MIAPVEFSTEIKIISFQELLCRLLYARELVRKFSANSLLMFSSTTESLVDRKVRTISERDISTLLIAAGFFVLQIISARN